MPTIAPGTLPERIEIETTRSSIAEVTSYLQEHVGQRLTAYLSGLKDAKTVGQWAAGRVIPRDAANLRLRHAYQAVRLVGDAFGDETAKAWLFGMNSQLDDEAPGFVLRHSQGPEEVARVVRAALAFVETGHGADLDEPTGAGEKTGHAAETAEARRVSDLSTRVASLERAQASLENQIAHLIRELKRPAERRGSGRGVS